jgi:hypothetical protein
MYKEVISENAISKVPELQFVNVSSTSGSQKHDDASRRIVRQNAMYAFSRQKLLTQSNRRPPPSLIDSNIAVENALHSRSSRFRLDSWSRKPRGSSKAVQAKRTHDADVKDGLKVSEVCEQTVPGGINIELNSTEDLSLVTELPLDLDAQGFVLQTQEAAQLSPRSRINIPRPPTAASLLDPFCTAALPLDVRLEGLLHRCMSRSAQSNQPYTRSSIC